MSELPRRLAVLLEDAAGEPPHDIELTDVQRQARRQRRLAAIAATAAVGGITLAVALPLTLLGGPREARTVTTAPSGTVTITPAQRLSPGQPVRVTVHGFPPAVKVWLSECATAGSVNAQGCGLQPAVQPFLLTDDSGTGVATFRVQSSAASGPLGVGHYHPCTSSCVLVATTGAVPGHQQVAYASLDFASDQPEPTVASEPPPVANGCLQHRPPCAAGVTLGESYPFEIDVHCGVTNAGFDGRLWKADPPLVDGGNPPRGWANPYQTGTMTLVTRDRAEFVADTADGPRTVRFITPPPGWKLGSCEW